MPPLMFGSVIIFYKWHKPLLAVTFHLMLLLFSATKCQMGKQSCYLLLKNSNNYGMKTIFRLQTTTSSYYRSKKFIPLPVNRTLNFHYQKKKDYSFQCMKYFSCHLHSLLCHFCSVFKPTHFPSYLQAEYLKFNVLNSHFCKFQIILWLWNYCK